MSKSQNVAISYPNRKTRGSRCLSSRREKKQREKKQKIRISMATTMQRSTRLGTQQRGVKSSWSCRVARHQRQRLVAANASKVFVVNTPGGGHAVLGFHLAKQLTADGHEVTIMVPGEEVRPCAREYQRGFCLLSLSFLRSLPSFVLLFCAR